MRFSIFFLSLFSLATVSLALPPDTTQPLRPDKFRSLAEILPTPNGERTASGAPGPHYWQQQADHEINVELNDTDQSLTASEKITYHNNSPTALSFLWLEVDPNIFSKHSDAELTETLQSNQSDALHLDKFKPQDLELQLLKEKFEGGLTIDSVMDATGKALPYVINGTMMRVDLPTPVTPGSTVTFQVAWHYKINDGTILSVRTGYEFFKKDKNYIYEIGNWYPRLCAYSDVRGWQNKAYLGVGEFALEFGNYLVKITVPEDHIVSASGELQNPEEVLTQKQRDRLKEASTAKKPVFIVTPQEAKVNEAHQATGKKTWVFKADQIRTFAFGSSRKFIWDAQGIANKASNERPQAATPLSKPIMAMSFYPNEAEPLWSHYSTAAMIHTLEIYSSYTFPYPYPTVNSVNGPIFGMEYSMLAFSGGPRPQEDGTYSKKEKEELIAVVIHETGHNYFPMVVNSDERQWTWMDEGLNTFLEHLATSSWEKGFSNDRCEPRNLVKYAKGSNLVPIMTSPDSLLRVGLSGYAKPAAALNVLRDTVMGPELFDFAFKTYAERWKFKRPEPADFFRTMNDASGMDLDWFWRGWFYSVDPCHVSIDNVHEYILDSGDPSIDKPIAKKEKETKIKTLFETHHEKTPKYAELHPELQDFYSSYDEFCVLPSEQEKFQELLKNLEKEKIDPKILTTKRHFYVVDFSNQGGLVVPLLLKIDYTDGTTEERRIPAQIWRTNDEKISKLIMSEKEIKGFQLDPHEELPEIDRDNNFWPRRAEKVHFNFFIEEKKKNPMQELQKK